MADEFNPDPWLHARVYIDRTYPSGVARERPIATTRIHCEPDELTSVTHNQSVSATERFNMQLRAGHGYRNAGEE